MADRSGSGEPPGAGIGADDVADGGVDLRLWQVAAQVLAGRDVDPSSAHRGGGWTNATWLTEEFVVRVARERESTDLRRECQLVALLPVEVGCPEIVDVGVRHGHEWVLTRRVAGRSLEEVWPSLDDAARASAVEQMWERAEHIHSVDISAVASVARDRSPFFPDNAADAMASLERLAAAGQLDARQVSRLGLALDRFWTVLPSATRVLNHGDLCVPNTLWRDGRVVAVLDFEFAVIAPLAIDANELIKLGFGPDQPAARTHLRDAVTGIAQAALIEPGAADLLVGYAIMLEAWLLESHLNSDQIDTSGRRQVTQLLTAFADHDGGYYAPLLDHLDS